MALKIYYPKPFIKQFVVWLTTFFNLNKFWSVLANVAVTIVIMIVGALLEGSTGWLHDIWLVLKDLIDNIGSGTPVPGIFLL
jgi:low affinity Fe/Cu permease